MDTKPLRILVIVNLPWDARLGATRVWMELAEEWRRMGHTVEKFALSDAYPGVRAARVTFALRQLSFTRKAAAFVRQNGHRFDVIDALIGALPFSREELGFRGIIVARSVGLYRLYEKFEQSAQSRWAENERGKFVGRLFYRFTRRRLLAASDRAVHKADLVNVPNEDEADCLRQELDVRRVIVQPYGLTAERRGAFANEARRLTEPRICFIGMWSARKGAYDWRAIIEAVRKKVPDVRFKFLGTMIEAQRVRSDLGPVASREVELISDYQPEELPRLLSDCTVGAFPSYVEGFGLAVIEQLAAGIPTVAYDIAGPRDILHRDFPELLVSPGDTARFASELVRLLHLDPAEYAHAVATSRAVAQRFSWSQIARETISAYRDAIARAARPIVFVQPFSLGWAGGGARILRALTEDAPMAWRSICSSPAKPEQWRDELHVRSRPSWGRIEHSRLAALPNSSTHLFRRRFQAHLRSTCELLNASAIHGVPHAGLDFAVAHSVARELSLPFFLSVHDDLAYTARVPSLERENAMQAAWRDAAARFVISDALGREYCRRYGERAFRVVTDGLTSLNPVRPPEDEHTLRIYFMGLFHMAYERNLRALLEAVRVFEVTRPDVSVHVTLRCEFVRPQVLEGFKCVTVLPFADEAQVQRDLAQADLLYMPIPFGAEHENFARYSLSTKMVTYVGSGVPLLYHGPATSAAHELLQQNDAALLVTTLDANEIAKALMTNRAGVAERALELARRHFMLADQRRCFWGEIARVLHGNEAAVPIHGQAA